ncbi:CbtA family protein [Natronobacterium texcoconense]|uniref:Uncharacterized membrane protein, predicted cobalt tansporter CbtA n=1 Tax=Natronobacterium texcoconense TaxID=1095778 RepID=A0A1H1IG47_NATTX|nr:CbtA family protein [Natronobacterium texcoconense]SDR36296.1 Uncharacterized membrane protein, predicted cobalt tansporter CbtA [Natronobacterium texcoconense]
MIYDYLKRGVAAGVLAGLAYGLYIALVANPLLEYIHDAGHGHDHSHGHDHGHGHDHSHAVSETTNAVVSVGSGILWGILLAGVFALAYYFLEPELPGRETATAAILGAAGFFSVSIVPWLVLPPAAPGGEATLGIDARLAIYTGLIGLGILVSGVAIVGYRRLAPAGRLKALAGASVPIVITVAGLSIAPPTIITQPDVADELVYAFQGSALLSQAALWALIAGGFVWFQNRARATPSSQSIDADDGHPVASNRA